MQILGAEARSRVRDTHVGQTMLHAAPPSLFLPLLKHAHAAAGDPDGADSKLFLARAFPRLEKWDRWLGESQSGAVSNRYGLVRFELEQ